MAIRPIRNFGDPVLRQKCRDVTHFDESLAALVQDLLDTVEQPGRAGLAAPQIGVGLRVFSYFVDGALGYVVNPVVVETDGHQDGEEGCLSLPGLWAPTPRADRAVVTGVDVEGRPIEVEGSGLLGRCLQHETDHLDGLLYIDRLERPLRRQVLAEWRARTIETAAESGR
jgi:peptide deformylase